MPASTRPTAEHERLADPTPAIVPQWRRWGPYVTDRSWGTVREDYSADGDAWDFLPARPGPQQGLSLGRGRHRRHLRPLPAPRASRLAFWNGRDPILKERLFGLTSARGQPRRGRQGVLLLPRHHADALLHEVPLQVPAGRVSLRAAGRGEPPARRRAAGVRAARHRHLRRRPLLRHRRRVRQGRRPRTSASGSRRSTAGRDAAPLHVLPHLWFRNTWAWGAERGSRAGDRARAGGPTAISRWSPTTRRPIRCRTCRSTTGSARGTSTAPPAASRCSPTTRPTRPRVFGPARRAARPYVKDAFHRHVVDGESLPSTRTGRHQGLRPLPRRRVPPGGSVVCRFRLTDRATLHDPLADVDAIVDAAPQRRPTSSTPRSTRRRPRADEQLVQRQALAGPALDQADLPLRRARVARRRQPRHAAAGQSRQRIRNQHWRHLNSMRVLSMPDKWEYPWFAAWDLAFHCVALALVDPAFAKDQLWLLLFEQFQHPNGQIPAYEWEFSDLNPPVHAWAVWRVYNMDRIRTGKADRDVPREVLPQAADQLRLVGQQGRPPGQQRLRGRLPRARQHHRRRPQRAAARRRGARAVRRDRLDGHVLPEPDADRAGAGARRTASTRRWRPSSSSTTSTSAPP